MHQLKLSSKEALKLDRILHPKARGYSVLKIGNAASQFIYFGVLNQC